MSLNNYVVWSEGLFLRPHHFQQQDRSHSYQAVKYRSLTSRNNFGLAALSIDHELLKVGKFSVNSVSGVFADHTVFDLPVDGPCPDPIEIPDDSKDFLVYLAIPLKKNNAANISYQRELADQGGKVCRYLVSEYETYDEILNKSDEPIAIQVLHLNVSLCVEGMVPTGFLTLPVAKVLEKKPDGRVVLDESFIPVCLDVAVSKNLVDFVSEIHGLLRHRATALANRLAQPGTSGVAEFSDFLLLQLCNRYEPLFFYFTKVKNFHPEDLYLHMIMLAGELSTFANKLRLSPEFPEYIHTNKSVSILPVLTEIRKSLNSVIEQNAISIPLIDKGRGVHLAEIVDTRLVRNASIVLAVFANVSTEQLRSVFPAQIKIGPTDKIRDLVMSQLPGISIKAMPVAPRQIPYYAGYTYFELDRVDDLWANVEATKALAMHIAGEFPGLVLELWAIRDK